MRPPATAMVVTEFVSTAGAVRSTTLLLTPSNRVQLRPIHAPPRRPGIPLYFRSALLSSAAEPCERISPLCPRLPVLLHSPSHLFLQNRISAKVVLERHLVCLRLVRQRRRRGRSSIGHSFSSVSFSLFSVSCLGLLTIFPPDRSAPPSFSRGYPISELPAGKATVRTGRRASRELLSLWIWAPRWTRS